MLRTLHILRILSCGGLIFSYVKLTSFAEGLPCPSRPDWMAVGPGEQLDCPEFTFVMLPIDPGHGNPPGELNEQTILPWQGNTVYHQILTSETVPALLLSRPAPDALFDNGTEFDHVK